MKISEIYKSIQGEGVWTNTESVFVRVTGCNLRCSFCDSPYTSWQPEGDERSVPEIVREVIALDAEHVVLTGGEPMLFPEVVCLTERLRELQRVITIETAGTRFLPVACDLMSISPKLRNATPSRDEHPTWHRKHEDERYQPQVLQQLVTEFEYQLKFVVSCPQDLDEVDDYLLGLPFLDRERTWLMPEGTTPRRLAEVDAWLIAACQARGYKHCPRKHIEWFGHVRGT